MELSDLHKYSICNLKFSIPARPCQVVNFNNAHKLVGSRQSFANVNKNYIHIHFIGRQIIRSRRQAFVFVLCVALSIVSQRRI